MSRPTKRLANAARLSALREAIDRKQCIRLMESFSPISAMIIESLCLNSGGQAVTYDGFWSSSLTDSTVRGKPDIELLDLRSRLANIGEIFENTNLPLVMDGDTGGQSEHLALNVPLIEAAGVSALIIEDKVGLKRNSLFGNDVFQEQADIREFSEKLKIAADAKNHRDFMIIARIESLILEKGMDDALRRAYAYSEAGADGVMIHSRRASADEVFEFARHYRRNFPTTPLVCVPTSFNSVRYDDLAAAGFNIVIYANQLLRAAYPAMESVARSILEHGRSLEAEPALLPIKDVLSLIPGAG
ncbi:phosphoenolpyruvate mutase [Burkholderia stagnalis]|uniref:phosphoenolpyruvate mutase n=1 Tax=Burkholderia stagnalis TaxID=1503054 RepID=A0ABX9YKA2_9BURK|nr:phosphoenolpyruvate mutase [Burkholderia stagnalis]RQQ21751.1 phosphoenolpyruvate mutase [Burkholderia stagnalis]RQQ23594.1 phosphoenolpyruvate mutase [Burkholderia stagnalis]RQQ41757.1 phosphoenolpyruvate mutase [Burkholderia stagnalis]RQQ56676.1 phosphoenolpyruvate mutase [Burkholderia stagnalis]RQQ65108.1 phosphoenolpyruvate mutase [Burkholderia stagnalis]